MAATPTSATPAAPDRVRVDADTHLYEPRSMWLDHCDPADRDLALRLVDDDLGHTWLTDGGGRRIHLAEVHHPADVAAMGAYRRRVRAGEPPEVPYDDALPADFWDPAARVAQLDGLGLAEAVVFPNYGLLWERPLEHDLPATLANLRAWNRWAGVIATEGGGRLHPVAHLTLRDPGWLEVELDRLAGAAIRLAMIAPALVDGRPLSHPDLDRAWAAFVDHEVTPVFHVAAFGHPFHDAWYDGDPDPVNPVLSSVFLWTAPALALADLAVNGVLARHPGLRIGVMELSAGWVPTFLLLLDGGFGFHAAFNGAPLTRLPEPPSAYVRRQVRVAAFAYEDPAALVGQLGADTFMFCSDWPHAEGIARPAADYEAVTSGLADADATALYAGNVRWLLRQA